MDRNRKGNIISLPTLRKLTLTDLKASLALGIDDFRSALLIDLCLVAPFVIAGLP